MKMLIAAACLAAPLFLLQEESATKGPVVGAPAPSLRLNDEQGLIRTVGGAAEEWTVLAFYPKAMTGG